MKLRRCVENKMILINKKNYIMKLLKINQNLRIQNNQLNRKKINYGH